MKTSKEMQLKILDKMRENVDGGISLYDGIECRYDGHASSWGKVVNIHHDNFEEWEFRIKPETITINGVDIPKPLIDSEILEDEVYYYVDNSEFLHEARHGEFIADHGIRFVYSTKEEAIEASKLLFGIED